MDPLLQPGATIADRYVLDEPLGRGAFGDVWSASRTDSDERVAIKFLRRSEGWAKRRFAREVQALARLQHPGCVKLLDFGMLDDGRAYLVTELVNGITLHDWMRRPQSPDRVIDVARQIAEAAAHAHRRDVLHRDLKPANILVQDSPGPQVQVLDFGIAKLSGVHQPDITKTGELIGTPGYMSPEQLRGSRDVGPASDVYALGVILFELLEGHSPFEGETGLEIAMKHLVDTTPQVSASLAAELRTLVSHMLAKDPADRPSMSGVADVLGGGAYEPAGPVHVRGPARPPSTQRDLRAPRVTDNRPRHWGIGALAITVLAISALGLWLRGSDPEPPRSPPRGEQDVTGLVRGLQPAIDAGEHDQKTLSDTGGADADPDLADRRANGSAGCGRDVLPGPGQLHHVFDGQRRVVRVIVPPNYEPDRPAPLLVLLHDLWQKDEAMLAIDPIRQRALQDGFILVAPFDELLSNTWTHVTDPDKAIADVELVTEELCVDTDRIYVIGHGNGALAAEQVACKVEGVAALVQTSHRLWAHHDVCREGDSIPRLFVSALDDPAAPLGGGRMCAKLGEDMWTLERQEAELRKRHRCRGKPRLISDDPTGRCWTAECDSQLVWCQAVGGRDWRSMRTRIATLTGPCASDPSAFDHPTRIWTFFEEVDAQRGRQ